MELPERKEELKANPKRLKNGSTEGKHKGWGRKFQELVEIRSNSMPRSPHSPWHEMEFYNLEKMHQKNS